MVPHSIFFIKDALIPVHDELQHGLRRSDILSFRSVGRSVGRRNKNHGSGGHSRYHLPLRSIASTAFYASHLSFPPFGDYYMPLAVVHDTTSNLPLQSTKYPYLIFTVRRSHQSKGQIGSRRHDDSKSIHPSTTLSRPGFWSLLRQRKRGRHCSKCKQDQLGSTFGFYKEGNQDG